MPSFNFGDAGGTSTNGASYTGAAWVRTEAGYGTGNTSINGTTPVSYTGVSIVGPYSNSYPSFGAPWAYLNKSGGTIYFSRFVDNGLSAFDAEGYEWSNGGLRGTVSYNTVPAQIGAPTATASTTSQGTVSLSWTAPNNGGASITNYRIFWESSANGSTGWSAKTEVTKSSSTSTSFAVTGLTVGTYYRFYVNAVNSVGTATYSTVSAVRQAPGNPGTPTSLSGTTSTTALGEVNLSWTAPTVTVTGITGYNIYATPSGGSRTKIATTIGTGTTYTATGLTQRLSYTFDVTARNAFSDSNTTESVQSGSASASASGVSSPPLSLTVVTGGLDNQLVLDWDAPSNTAGTLTGYYVYRSTGALVGTINDSTSTLTLTSLVPGQSYGYYVRARNTLSDLVSTFGEASTTVYGTPTGQPDAPTIVSLTASTLVAGSATLTWIPSLAAVYSNIYRVYPGTSTPNELVASVKGSSYTFYGLTPGVTYSYKMSTTNPYGDGPLTTTASSVTPVSTTIQSISNSTVTDTTNQNVYNGTYNISAIPTSTSFTYQKTASDLPLASVTGTFGQITDITNDDISETNATITTSGPTTNTFSYTKAPVLGTGDITTPVAVSAVTATNNTNALFNGTYIVQADAPTSTISYAKTATNVSSRVATGTVTNQTNSTYNGFYTISSVTEDTFSYSSSGSTQTTTASAGVVDNITNRSLFNGDEISITAVPEYNTISYQAKPSYEYRNYIFDSSTVDADPGSGDVRFNSGTIGSVNSIFISNIDSSLASQVAWYSMWDDGLSVTNKGTLVVAQGTNTWTFAVTGDVVSTANNYHKIPVSYVSGTSLPTTASVSIAFIPYGITSPNYTFSTTTTMGDPGTGAIRLNSATLTSITTMAIDNTDSGSVSRTSWYSTWDDNTAASTRGRIIIRNGANSLVLGVTAGVTASSGYYTVPVTYVSGSLPANSASLYVLFIPAISGKAIATPYGTARKANSTAQLEVQYRSGWLG